MSPRRRLTLSDVRKIALALPETAEGSHMGHADLRVRNKIFAGLPNDGRTINLMATPENVDALVAADPDTFRDVWGGRWIGVRLDRVSLKQLRELIEDAWRVRATKPAPRRRSGSPRTR